MFYTDCFPSDKGSHAGQGWSAPVWLLSMKSWSSVGDPRPRVVACRRPGILGAQRRMLLFGAGGSENAGLVAPWRRSKACDLKEQLIWWQTPPEPAWPAREQRLDWLEHALGEARDISRGLQQHGALTPESGCLATYVDIVRVRPLPPPRAPLAIALHGKLLALLHGYPLALPGFRVDCGVYKGVRGLFRGMLAYTGCAQRGPAFCIAASQGCGHTCRAMRALHALGVYPGRVNGDALLYPPVTHGSASRVLKWTSRVTIQVPCPDMRAGRGGGAAGDGVHLRGRGRGGPARPGPGRAGDQARLPRRAAHPRPHPRAHQAVCGSFWVPTCGCGWRMPLTAWVCLG